MSPNGQSPLAQTGVSSAESSGPAANQTVYRKPGRLLRLGQVEGCVSLKKSSIYAGVKSGTFPAPVRLSVRAVAWREEDIDRWISERVRVGESA